MRCRLSRARRDCSSVDAFGEHGASDSRDYPKDDPEALLFTSNTGYPIRHRNFLRRVWYPTLCELGLPLVGLHVLRHSAAARMIGAGWSAKAVQSTLGHASASFTLTVYGHLFPSDMDELAAALESPRRRTGDVQAATTH
jgi:integrase